MKSTHMDMGSTAYCITRMRLLQVGYYAAALTIDRPWMCARPPLSLQLPLCIAPAAVPRH